MIKKEYLILFIISFIIWNLYFIFTTDWYHPFLQFPLSFFSSYLIVDVYYHLENKKKKKLKINGKVEKRKCINCKKNFLIFNWETTELCCNCIIKGIVKEKKEFHYDL